MNSEKRKNNGMNNGRDCASKGGRPVKGVTKKLKYCITVKMATKDYYLLKSKAKLEEYLPVSLSVAASRRVE